MVSSCVGQVILISSQKKTLTISGRTIPCRHFGKSLRLQEQQLVLIILHMQIKLSGLWYIAQYTFPSEGTQLLLGDLFVHSLKYVYC